ncbi:heme-copper oxidase subunit III [Saccharicrinis sp. FJH54]|uniref:cytochrome c oxidase subunit 3 n=1 Tax=Saccharicrinis sp. FJH54 TaxID=3344665 RepID=UPI0035D5225A
MSKNKLMMTIFVASEAFFFIALIISYVFYSHAGGRLSASAKYLDVPKTAVFTVMLLASSLTIEVANRKLKKNQRKSMLWWLGASVVLGLIFLIGQGLEYETLISEHITVSKNLFGSAFFTLTGFHGFHVLIGLIVLTIIGGLIRSGAYMKVEYDTLNTATVYWHFVDAVWVVVFSVVYIGSLI